MFYWLHEMAACCYFGVDLRNGLDYNFPSRLRDGTLTCSPYFPLYFTSFFTLTCPLLLPLESKQCPLTQSKQCPLTLAPVLACADSADKLRFWNKSESYCTSLTRSLEKELALHRPSLTSFAAVVI